MSRIVDIEPLLKKYDGMNEGTEFSPIHFINDLMALEQLLYGQPKQPCIEDYPTCTECEHYDREKHYCPRFCQVIKDTLAEAQPCEDCISRQAVIDHICEDKECYKEECKGRTLKRCPDLQWVFDLPSVKHERPKGKWIKVDPLGMGDEAYMCSACKTGDWSVTVGEYKFCPYCGAEMSGGGEDEVSD